MQKVRRFLSNVQIPLRILYIRAFELSKKVKIAWGGGQNMPPQRIQGFPYAASRDRVNETTLILAKLRQS